VVPPLAHATCVCLQLHNSAASALITTPHPGPLGTHTHTDTHTHTHTHRGKNHERAFKHPACPIRDNLPRFGQLEAFAAASDPQGIFQPRLFSDIAARAANSYAPACATLGQCYCTEDVHCAAGFRCLPSLAFPEYRACRL
jgi:hypothetical protein